MRLLKAKPKYYQEAYRFDEKEKAYRIEVSLDAYEDVYDEWDPSPFKKRDIEDEFDDFIMDSSSDIPPRFNLMIDLYLPSEVKNAVKEKLLMEAYDNFYRFKYRRALKERQSLSKKVIANFVLAVIFLFIGYFYEPGIDSIFLMIIKEGLFIGGWVFLWEVFTLIFITLVEENRALKAIHRLVNVKIRFHYE